MISEKEAQIAEYFLKSFEEKSPLDYDILDSMVQEIIEILLACQWNRVSSETHLLDHYVCCA